MPALRVTVDADALKTFLPESNRAGYAGDDEEKWKRENESRRLVTEMAKDA